MNDEWKLVGWQIISIMLAICVAYMVMTYRTAVDTMVEKRTSDECFKELYNTNLNESDFDYHGSLILENNSNISVILNDSLSK